MKKRIYALLLSLVLLASLLPVSASDTLQGEMTYAFLQEVADFIRENGYYSDDEDDPLLRAIISILQEDEEAWQIFLTHMLGAYDDRSMYIPAEYMGGLQTSGYVGVGVTITIGEEGMVITDMNPQGSAYRAGLQVGDIIVAVDGAWPESFGEMSMLAESLRGEEGTTVTLDITRDGQPIRFVLTRIRLGAAEFSGHLLETGIYYMQWSQFKTPESMEDFYAALDEMAALDCGSLILDLRGNRGGLLSMAYDVVNALVPDKVAYLKTTYRKEGEMVEELHETDGTGVDLDQIIVLVDGSTASASEIIVTGLCDTGNAISMGIKTYGKGTAQYEVSLSDGSLIILTAFHVESVTKGSYDRTGISPDYWVENYDQADPNAPLRLPEAPLSYGNCSDEAQRLNEALMALGYLGLEQKLYLLGEATQAALDALRQDNGLAACTGLDAETAALINRLLEAQGILSRRVDAQLDMALDFARRGMAG